METTTINGTRIEVQEINEDGSMVIQRWHRAIRDGEEYGLELRYEPTDRENVYDVIWAARPWTGDGEEFGGKLDTSDFAELGDDGHYDTWAEVEANWDELTEAAEAEGIDLGDIEVS